MGSRRQDLSLDNSFVLFDDDFVPEGFERPSQLCRLSHIVLLTLFELFNSSCEGV
jgi:hypothetical protein